MGPKKLTVSITALTLSIYLFRIARNVGGHDAHCSFEKDSSRAENTCFDSKNVAIVLKMGVPLCSRECIRP